MVFSKHLQQLLCDIKIFVISNNDKVPGTADLLWFEENDKFQLKISENKYLIFFIQVHGPLKLLKHYHFGAYKEAFRDHLVQPPHFKDKKTKEELMILLA